MVSSFSEDRVDGPVVSLVPFLPSHVPLYHVWMSNPSNLELTGSEPVSLEEQEKVRLDWIHQSDRHIFIIERAGAIVGDIGVVLMEEEEEEQDPVVTVEIDVMVGEESARRGGIATAAVGMMERWAAERMAAKRIVAKIKDHNTPSLSLFRKLGYSHEKPLPIFNEIHLTKELK